MQSFDKINILHISPNFNYSCGVSKYVFDLLEHYNSDDNIKTFYITNGGDAISKLEQAGISYHLIPFSNGYKNIFHIFSTYRQIKEFCIKNNINIIHTHHRFPEMIAWLLKKKINVITVTTAHSFVKGFKFLSFKSDKIIAVSKPLKNQLLNSFKLDSKEIEVLNNFVKIYSKPSVEDVTNLREEIRILTNDFVFLFVGRINKIKGTDILIHAFLKLHSKYADTKLIFVGEIQNDMVSYFNGYNIEGTIYYGISDSVNNFYEISDCVILPSRTDPFPYVMLEAGLFEKSFIGSNVDGVAEFIGDEKSGLLFEKGSVNDLFEKMERIYFDADLRKLLGVNLNKKVQKLTNSKKYFKKLETIYNNLLNEIND